MGLREQAALDCRSILEDSTSGFGWPFTLTSPTGVVAELVGFTTDIGQTIDPETGQAVAGRKASVAVSLRSLVSMPAAIADSRSKPWVVTFADIQGVVSSWKVIEVLPDRAVAVVVLLLEAYQQAPGSTLTVVTGALRLPSLRLVGALAPAVGSLSGDLATPSLQLVGALAPAVGLSGDLTAPSLQSSGVIRPAVSLSGTLTLPSLRVVGAFAHAAAIAGAPALPSQRLSGSMAPAVELAGALTLPRIWLAGAVSPAVSFAGAVTLPSQQVSGGFAHTPGEGVIAGEMTLPSVQAEGEFAVAVTLSGELTLPSQQLSGGLESAVGVLAGALALPSLETSGGLTPVVDVEGAMSAPSLQVEGEIAPAVSLDGGIALPSQQVSGGVAPAVSLSGTLTLPSQQLAGSVAPAVSLSGSPTLPSQQLAGSFLVPTPGFVPSDISVANGGPLSGWLQLANATLVGGDVSSLPDGLNSNPAVQTVAGRRPTLENSAGNGLPCMRFAVNDSLSWPLIAANNGTAATGFGLWFKPNALDFGTLLAIKNVIGGANIDKLNLQMSGSSNMRVFAYMANLNGRRGQSPVGVISTGWQFATLEYLSSGATEALKLVLTVGAVTQLLTFTDTSVTPVTLGTLPTVTGNALIGNQQNHTTAFNPFFGLIGPDIFSFSGPLTAQHRLDLMSYQRPT